MAITYHALYITHKIRYHREQTMSGNIGARDHAAGGNKRGGQEANQGQEQAPPAAADTDTGTPAVEAEAEAPEEEAPAQEEPPPAAITQVLTKTFDGTTSTHRPSNTSTERPLEYFVWEETENCGRAMASQ